MVGDIMHVETGEILPIDGIFIQGTSLLIDESSITGETDLVEKIPALKIENQEKNGNPFLISGTRVMDGIGTILVCAVGVNSVEGKIKLMYFSNKKIII